MSSDAAPAGRSALPAVIDQSRATHAALALERGWSFTDVDAPDFTVDPAARDLLTARDVRRFEAIPISVRGNQVTVAVANPDDPHLVSQLRMLLSGRTMRLVYANPTTIGRLIDAVYSAATEAEKVSGSSQARVPTVTTVASGGRVAGGPDSEQVQLLGLIIEQALRERASDIHIEPVEDGLEIRNRVDGNLRPATRHPAAVGRGLLTLIKIQAEMRAGNFLTPDSGVLQHQLAGRAQPVDIRVETAPTAWGDSAVLRLQGEIWRALDTLGFSATNEARFRRAISQPYGIVVVTGPTGSGKSTTLYSTLAELIDPRRKIITLENPVEYKIPAGVTQMSVEEEKGMTFSLGLRSILRQDPDVVFIGEVRDRESAETAVDAAMTGHLVLTSLHTNDAVSLVPRLTRMGIDPALVATSLLCVVGQRLVRRLCEHCKQAVDPDPVAIREAGFDPDEVTEQMFGPSPDGCARCTGGFRGRVPVHEVMLLGDELAQAISQDAPEPVLKAAAQAAGMTTLREDGWEKVKAGITSLAELDANTLSTLV